MDHTDQITDNHATYIDRSAITTILTATLFFLNFRKSLEYMLLQQLISNNMWE